MGNVLEGEELEFQNLYETPFRSTAKNTNTKKRIINALWKEVKLFFLRKVVSKIEQE